MLKKCKNTRNFLSIMLLCSIYPGPNVFSAGEIPSEPYIESSSVQSHDTKLSNKAIEQLKKIDLSLEKLAQAINSGHVKVKSKDEAKNYIQKIRYFIYNKVLVDNTIEYSQLIVINSELIKSINAAVNSNFSELIFISDNFFKFDTLEEQSALNCLELNDQALSQVVSKFKNIGVTKLNRLVKDAENFAKSNKITKKAVSATKRMLPYFGLATYLYLKEQNSFEDIPYIKNIPYIGKALGRLKCADTDKNNPQVVKIEADKSESTSSNSGFGLYNLGLKTLFSFESKSVFNIAIGSLMAPIIKKDIQGLYKWSGERFEDVLAVLKGESIKDRSVVKKQKTTFEDIPGNQNIKDELNSSIINYFKNKELFDLVGHKLPACYVISGEIDIAYNLVNAISGEINKITCAKDASKFCGVYSITASDLLDKESKKIISDVEGSKAHHAIILIKNLDWLYNHASNKAKVWNNLTQLLKTVQGKSKISVFITIKDDSLLDRSIIEHINRKFIVNKPNESDIKEYLIKEFKNRCVDISNFDLDTLAKSAQKLPFENLKFALNRAFTNAYLDSRVLTQSDIQQSILSIK